MFGMSLSLGKMTRGAGRFLAFLPLWPEEALALSSGTDTLALSPFLGFQLQKSSLTFRELHLPASWVDSHLST